MQKPLVIARQSARPRGLLGHLVARVMALDTRAVNRWVLSALAPRTGERVLELGSGHGRTLAHVARAAAPGLVVGVDPSEVMRRVARRHLRTATSRISSPRVATGGSARSGSSRRWRSRPATTSRRSVLGTATGCPGSPRRWQKRVAEEGLDNITVVLGGYDDPALPDGAIDLAFTCLTYHHIEARPEYFRRLRRDLSERGRVAHLDDRPDAPPPFRWFQSEGHWSDPDAVRREMAEAGYRRLAEHDFLPVQSFQIFVPSERAEAPAG